MDCIEEGYPQEIQIENTRYDYVILLPALKGVVKLSGGILGSDAVAIEMTDEIIDDLYLQEGYHAFFNDDINVYLYYGDDEEELLARFRRSCGYADVSLPPTDRFVPGLN